MTKATFGGVEIFTGGIDYVILHLKESLKLNRKIKLHLCNAFTLSLSRDNKDLYKALMDSDLNLPDGRPLAFCISPTKDIQIRGMKLFETIISDNEFRLMRHLFFGIAPEKKNLLFKSLSNIFDNFEQFEVVESPYVAFEELDFAKLNECLRVFKPHFIWIGLGTPKQDLSVEVIAEFTNHPCAIIPVGAVFDFIIGQSDQAPELLSKLGFEWLYRWAWEPRRLASRYTKYNFIFLFQVVVYLIGRMKFRVNRL